MNYPPLHPVILSRCNHVSCLCSLDPRFGFSDGSNPVSAALQIIVYAGAILVLLLFVIMMLNAHEEESPQDDLYFQRYLALGVGALLVGGSFWFIKQSELLQSLSERPVDQIAPISLNQIGAEMLTRHIVSFEMIGLLLLVSMIGAISLVKKHL